MKAIFVILGVLGIVALGGVVVTVIDILLGVSFENVSVIAHITHMVVNMFWGAMVAFFLVNRLR